MSRLDGEKGISPLIAAVILIAFVIAVANIAGPWFQTFLRGKTTQVEEKSEKSVDCMYAGIDFGIGDVEYSTDLSSNLVNITVDNSGDEPLYNLTVSYVISGESYTDVRIIRNKPTASDPLRPGSRRVLITEIQNTSSLQGKVLESVRMSTLVCPNLERTCNLVTGDCQ